MRLRGRWFGLFAACFVLIAGITEASAAAEDTASTAVTVQLLPGSGEQLLLDPDNPGVSRAIAPGEVATQMAGPLTLNLVPAFAFGEGTNPLEILPYPTWHRCDLPQQPVAQVSDLRGTGGGWTLKVQASAFTGTSGQPSIPGAKLRFSNGSAKSSNEALMLAGTMPTLYEVSADCADNASPVVLARAASGAGMGGWVLRWYQNESGVIAGVELLTPAVPIETGEYHSTLTWYLEDAP